MESTLIQKSLEALLEQGIMGIILVILFVLFKKFIEKLFVVVENNTQALTQNAESIKSMQKVINQCQREGKQ